MVALTRAETHLLDSLIPDNTPKRRRESTLSPYLTKIARLGGYLARTKDPRRATWSCGAVYNGSQISNPDSSWALNLCVIQRFRRRLQTYVTVAGAGAGNWAYLYRAVDSAGETIEFMLSPSAI